MATLQEELQVIAQTIRGESATIAGQNAVAQVMYNRMVSGLYPSTAYGVVTQGSVGAGLQFDANPVTGGNPFTGNPGDNANNLAAYLQAGLPVEGGVGNALNFQSGNLAYRSGLAPSGTLIPEGTGGNWFGIIGRMGDYQPGVAGIPSPPERPAEFGPSAGQEPAPPAFGGDTQMPDGTNSPDNVAPQGNGEYSPPIGGTLQPISSQGDYYQPGTDPGNDQGYVPAGPGDATQLPTLEVQNQGNSSVLSELNPISSAQASEAPQGVETGTYQGQSYTYATPGGPQTAAGYQGPDANAPIAPAQTDNLPLQASGGTGTEQVAGLQSGIGAAQFPPPLQTDASSQAGDGGYVTQGPTAADTSPDWAQGPTGSYGPGGAETLYTGGADGATTPAATDQPVASPSTPGSDNLPLQASGASGAQMAAGLQDQSSLKGSAQGLDTGSSPTSGLPGPLQQILGGQPPGSDAQAPNASGQDSSGGAPVDITDISGAGAKGLEAASKAITGAGKTVGQSAQQLGQVAAQDTQSLVQAASKADQQAADIAQTSLSHLSNLFQRGMVAFMGLVLIGGAVYYFSKHQGSAS